MANVEPRLTRDQLDHLRRRLEDERSRILNLLRPTPISDGERSEFEETAQRAAELDERIGLLERERRLLAEVEAALSRIRGGTYGVDEGTGDPIPYERLAAIPWARGVPDR
jgi:DnaK suppressor protein